MFDPMAMWKVHSGHSEIAMARRLVECLIYYGRAAAGERHNAINVQARDELKLYTIYSPPEHIDRTVRHTKKDAEAQPEEYDGKPTE